MKGKAIELLTRQPEGGINVTGIRAVVAHLALDPAGWNQRSFSGTSVLDHRRVAYCFAAWTLILAGHDIEQLLQEDISRIPVQVAAMLGLSRRQINQLIMWGVDADPHPTIEQFKEFITVTTGVLFDASEFDYSHWAPARVLVGAA